ncbi:MAG: oligosaccharide flippase family protein [Bacteroidota bacterium]|nr:oligosaccharide flippase family protein [Bacteroidota bacterium]
MLKKIIKSEFSKNVLTLMTGTTIAQIIGVAISPIITRIYSPEDFGIFALFFSLVSLISIIVTGQYESAIMLPETDEDALAVVSLSFILTCIISFLTLISVWLFNHQLTLLLNNSRMSDWLYIVPLSVFLTGLYNILSFWVSRKKMFKRLALRTITQSTSTSGLKLALGFGGIKSSGLIISTIVGQIIATGWLGLQFWKEDHKRIKYVSVSMLKKNALKYQDFPKYNAAQGFMDSYRDSGIALAISSFYNTYFLGIYSFSMTMLQKPMVLIGSAISQVFFQKLSETLNNQQNIWKLTKKIIIKQLFISVPAFLILVLFAPDLFAFVFSENWRKAGEYSQILAPFIILRYIISPITSLPMVLNKQKQFLILSFIINFMFPAIFFITSMFSSNIKIALWIISIFGSIYMIYLYLWLRKICIQCNPITK